MELSPKVLLLANHERLPLFDGVMETQDIVHVTAVLDAIRFCVANPPRAVLVDMASVLHLGVSETAPLYEMGINMPVIRCSQSGREGWVAMCQAPFRRVTLLQALEEIRSADPLWKHPKYLRRHVRVNYTGRVLFRKVGGTEWRRGNCSAVSISGMFLLSQEFEGKGCEIEIEVMDALPKNPVLRGHVTWVHRWDDGPHMPGMGIEFTPNSVPDEFRKFLGDVYYHRFGSSN